MSASSSMVGSHEILSLSPGVLKTHLLTHFSWNELSIFILGLVSFDFAFLVFFSSSPKLCSLKAFQVGCWPSKSSLNQLVLLFALLVSLYSPPISSPLYHLPGASWQPYFTWKRILDALFRSLGDSGLLLHVTDNYVKTL